MKETEPKSRQLEEALKGLIKLVKAGRFYPSGHPALKTAATQALQAFSPLLKANTPLAITVRKEGFFLEEEAIAPTNPNLQKLALALFARRIHRLLILPDLSPEDLRGFTRCLGLSPADIRAGGGIQEVLLRARVSTLWVNETDLERILARKEEIEAEKAALPDTGEEADLQPSPPAVEAVKRDLRIVLEELKKEKTDGRYQQLLKELIPMVPLQLNAEGLPLVLTAFSLLCMHASDRQRPRTLREHSLHALSQLTTDEALDFLTTSLCDKSLAQNRRENILKILVFLKGKTIRYLMDRLAAESDASARRILAEALIRQGSAAVPTLIEYLSDERWYVVRNAVAILGDIRDQETAVHLTSLLQHPDLRVRRETIRALTRIGGAGAVGILLRTLEGDDQDLRRQALLSLGAMKHPAAVPTLLELINRPDLRLKNADVTKEAIKALGEICSAEAVPALLVILNRRKFWQRRQFDEIRTAAALALGEIGNLDAAEALEAATDDRSATVARAAVQALKQLKKGKEHGSGTR